MVLVVFILVLAGLGLLVLGLRGRVVAASRSCARCGYELTGLTGSACPECGGSLARGRAVRTSRRVRRVWVIAGGVVLLACGLGGAGVMMWAKTTGRDWLRIAPTWYLLGEIRVWDEARAGAVVDEIERRWRTGGLSAQAFDAYIEAVLEAEPDRADPVPRLWVRKVGEFASRADIRREQREMALDWMLSRHGDRSKPWHWEWDWALEEAFGEDDPSRLARYFEGLASPRVWSEAPAVHSGQTVPLAIDYGLRSNPLSGLRMGRGWSVQADAEPVGVPFVSVERTGRFSRDVLPEGDPYFASVTVRGSPGEYRIPVLVRVTLNPGRLPAMSKEFRLEAVVTILEDRSGDDSEQDEP